MINNDYIEGAKLVEYYNSSMHKLKKADNQISEKEIKMIFNPNHIGVAISGGIYNFA